MMETKRLLKDLPFLKVGAILIRFGSYFKNAIPGGSEYYFRKSQSRIITDIWENSTWFAAASVPEPSWEVLEDRALIFFTTPLERFVFWDDLAVKRLLRKTLEKFYKQVAIEEGWGGFAEAHIFDKPEKSVDPAKK
jgi:hypothetical protein